MTHHEFNKLSLAQQADIVWNCGTFIAERQEENHTIMLYQIEGFYVEVFYSRNKRRIPATRSFTSTYLLQPYLDAIDLKDIVF